MQALIQWLMCVLRSLATNSSPDDYNRHLATLHQLAGEDVPDHLKPYLIPDKSPEEIEMLKHQSEYEEAKKRFEATKKDGVK